MKGQRNFKCVACDFEFEVPFVTGQTGDQMNCPNCGAQVYRVDNGGGRRGRGFGGGKGRGERSERAGKQLNKVTQNNPQVAVGISAVGSAILKTGISFVKKPAVIAYIKHIFHPKKLDKYSIREVREVEKSADWIVDFFKEKEIRLNRIGIDGLPGSGKSTLANALSNLLKMEWISLRLHLKLPMEKKSEFPNLICT